MTQVLNGLWEVSVYSAVLYAAIMLFKKTFRKYLSAALSCGIWALLVLRLMLPVTLDTGLRFFVVPESAINVTQTERETGSVGTCANAAVRACADAAERRNADGFAAPAHCAKRRGG